jgi:hypothetical protein
MTKKTQKQEAQELLEGLKARKGLLSDDHPDHSMIDAEIVRLTHLADGTTPPEPEPPTPNIKADLSDSEAVLKALKEARRPPHEAIFDLRIADAEQRINEIKHRMAGSPVDALITRVSAKT